jgi:hypothetical protein
VSHLPLYDGLRRNRVARERDGERHTETIVPYYGTPVRLLQSCFGFMGGGLPASDTNQMSPLGLPVIPYSPPLGASQTFMSPAVGKHGVAGCKAVAVLPDQVTGPQRHRCINGSYRSIIR